MPGNERCTPVRAAWWLTLVLSVVLSGCTSVVGGTPKAAPRGGPAGGPIFPSQLDDLLTPSKSFSVVPNSPLSETDMQSALFIGADPPQCHGVVAFGRFPLFPSNYTGREARTQQDGQTSQHQLLEVSATYPSDFDAPGFLSSIRKTVSGCQHPVSAWGDIGRRTTVTPTPLVPDNPPEVARWSTNLAGQHWVCEFAVISKANVVSEIVTCSPDRSVDITTLVTKRLKKIDELLKSRS